MATAGRATHFEEVVARLSTRLQNLVEKPAAPRGSHSSVPNVPGIYLFSERGRPIYVGQTSDLRRRLGDHTRPSSGSESATLAFILATEMAKRRRIDAAGTRKQRLARPDFNAVFLEAKKRVAAMPVSFILMDDPIERTMFEMYAALHLGTERYNSFETH
ncbi:MAG: GIY-YIG nuclease family protein [Chloroflexi bacterium]|nr:GIY-YIG nuclease family protein [Chloroflexota bacterium]